MKARLFQSWGWLHLVSVGALLLHTSIPAPYFGRYSQNALIILAMGLLSLPFAFVVGYRWGSVSRPRLPNGWYWLGVGMCWLALAGIWGMPFASALPYQVIRLYLSVILVSVATWLMPTFTLSRGATRLAMGLGGAALLVLLGLSTRFPAVLWVDEAYMASLSWNFGHTAQLEPLVYRHVSTESYALIYMALGGWYRLVGFGFAQGRFFLYMLALLMLGFTFYTARRVYSHSAAWAVLILGAPALLMLNVYRQDISVGLYLSVAFLLYALAHHTQRRILHVLVGFFVAFATDGHPSAYRFSLAFGVAYTLENLLQMIQHKRFFIDPALIYLAIGGVMGVATYIGIYATLAQDFLSLASRSPFLEVSTPWYRLIAEQLFVPLGAIPLVLGCAVLGAGVAVRLAHPLNRVLVVVWAVNMGFIAFFYGFYRSYYLAHSIGIYLLLAVALVYVMIEQLHISPPIVLSGLAMASLGLTVHRVGFSDLAVGYHEAFALADAVREYVPPDQRLVGIDPMYFRMADYDDFVEVASAPWLANREGITRLEAWERIQPSAVVIVEGYPTPPDEALRAYVAQDGWERVACWEGERVGHVDLFMRSPIPPIQSPTCQSLKDTP